MLLYWVLTAVAIAFVCAAIGVSVAGYNQRDFPLMVLLPAVLLFIAAMLYGWALNERDYHYKNQDFKAWFIEEHDPLAIENYSLDEETVEWISQKEELCMATVKDGVDGKFLIFGIACQPLVAAPAG